MSSLNRRLCRLETATGRECPECGLSPDEFVGGDYEVLWFDREDDEVESDEFCETCGAQLSFTVGWADLPEVPGGGG